MKTYVSMDADMAQLEDAMPGYGIVHGICHATTLKGQYTWGTNYTDSSRLVSMRCLLVHLQPPGKNAA
jgi:hypothetical protein